MQFATNFLGHFALTTGLHAALTAASGARIVSVSSSANMMALFSSTTRISTSSPTTRGSPTAVENG
jgi:NAD(P)-dependent dehydrogenase (short-subunit alcohol dehydrogenase family)